MSPDYRGRIFVNVSGSQLLQDCNASCNKKLGMRLAATRGPKVTVQRHAKFTFLRWNAMFLTGYAVAHAILVAIASLALNHRLGARIWVVLYLPLIWCGSVESVLVYWARQSYDRPKAGAIRLALGILGFLNLYLGALLFGAVKLGFLSGGDALNSYAPYILPVSILASVGVYLAARESLESSQSE